MNTEHLFDQVATIDGKGERCRLNGLKLYLPPTSGIRLGSRVEVGGETYEVIAEPVCTQAPTGHAHHIEAMLTRYRDLPRSGL